MITSRHSVSGEVSEYFPGVQGAKTMAKFMTESCARASPRISKRATLKNWVWPGDEASQEDVKCLGSVSSLSFLNVRSIDLMNSM